MTSPNDGLSDPQVFDRKDWGVTNGESLAVRKKVSIVWPRDEGLDAKRVRGLSEYCQTKVGKARDWREGA